MLAISTFLLFLLPLTRPEAEDITFLYLEISMELIEAMKDTDADEGELHQASLAKNIVYYDENQQELQKLYDAYLLNKSDIIKNAFINNYVHKKRLEYVRERVDRNLAYFLNHDQINKVKNVIEEKLEATTSSENLIHAVKEELAKDIGEKKAGTVVEMVRKQLRILRKRHGGWLEKASKLFYSLVKHDEH